MSEDSDNDPDLFPIPSDYELLDFVGSGSYGTVAKCRRRDTGETVAIKISRFVEHATQEASILEQLMRYNLDQSNIVKFYDSYQMNNTTGLVLEMLDMSLSDYMQEQRLPLTDIRLIIQQLATALDGLKSVGVIHGDLKPNNIMLVQEQDQDQPWTLKLIDFGLAFHRSEAVVGSALQLSYYRAPEIILGLPFTEAIDIWSLGALMGLMMFGTHIFPWYFEYSQIQSICEILGQPADHLLDAGLKTKYFFIKTSDNQWTLKTHDQYWKNNIFFGTKKCTFSSLDDLKTLSEKMEGEAEGWRQCVDLLKEMLQVDASKRITPGEILSHPFITQSYLKEAVQSAAHEQSNSSSRDLTHIGTTEAVTETDHRTQSDQAQDAQGDRNTTLECLIDTLSCETLMLDPDPAEEIQALKELEDTTSDNSECHEEEEKKKKKKKKKKNPIRRFFSWMRRTFSCRSSVHVEEYTSQHRFDMNT